MSRFKKGTPEAVEELLGHRRMSTSLHDLQVIRALIDLKIQVRKGELDWFDASVDKAIEKFNEERKVKG